MWQGTGEPENITMPLHRRGRRGSLAREQLDTNERTYPPAPHCRPSPPRGGYPRMIPLQHDMAKHSIEHFEFRTGTI
jgi:hypothetical protein